MHALRFFVVSAFFTLFGLPFFAFAQTTTDQAYQDTLNKLMQQQQQVLQQAAAQKSSLSNYLDVKINPESPEPNVPVVISIESYLTDLYKANISWSLDGKVLLRGIGKTAFTFKNGPAGQTTRVSVTVTTNTGEVATNDFSFTPVGVTMMWEADTYTPPFYKGKALLTPQAGVRLVAIPNATGGNALSPGKLVYDWKKDDSIDGAASGYGKNVYSFVGPKPLTNTKITLAVSSLDDTAQSEMQFYLPQVQPFILFYEKDPLLGVLHNKPLGAETTLNKKEFSVVAEPYFFSNEAREGAVAATLKYNWSVNGNTVQNYGRAITLRNDTGAKGSSIVSLAMSGVAQTFQRASKDLRVNFSEVSNSTRPTF